VDILLANGLRVTATVQDGVWGAWWPLRRGDPTGSPLDVHTTTDTQAVDLDDADLAWPVAGRLGYSVRIHT